MAEEDRFLYRLAADLGQPNPEWMAATMPAHVFNNWRAYYAEPRGEDRLNWYMANLCWVIAENHRLLRILLGAQSQPESEVADYLVTFGEPEANTELDEETVEDRRERIQAAEVAAWILERRTQEFLNGKRR